MHRPPAYSDRSKYERAESARPRYAPAMDPVWIKRRLKERGSSIADFGRAIQRERAVASKIVHGDVKLQIWQAPLLARLLGVSQFDVLKMAGLPLSAAEPRAVQILSWVEAGELTPADPVEADDDRPAVLVDHPSNTLYALEVRGDSMDRIAPEGSIIVFDYSAEMVEDRDLAVFRRDGETTFKRFRRDETGAWLEPESFNRRHGPLVLGEDEELVLVGRVVAIPRLGRAATAS